MGDDADAPPAEPPDRALDLGGAKCITLAASPAAAAAAAAADVGMQEMLLCVVTICASICDLPAAAREPAVDAACGVSRAAAAGAACCCTPCGTSAVAAPPADTAGDEVRLREPLEDAEEKLACDDAGAAAAEPWRTSMSCDRAPALLLRLLRLLGGTRNVVAGLKPCKRRGDRTALPRLSVVASTMCGISYMSRFGRLGQTVSSATCNLTMSHAQLRFLYLYFWQGQSI